MGFSKFGSKCDDRTVLLGELLGGILMMLADATSKCCLSEHYGQPSIQLPSLVARYK